jgi:DNA repair protein RecN (Recombination protein N)
LKIMLNELSIKNFAIIDDIRISFADGFSVLTGETGAGKSIIIEAVNLLLGSRASSDLVRSGCDNAELEAFFDIDGGSKTAKILQEQGMDASEGLMLRRVIAATGKSRVFINSRQSTLDLLKQLTADLAGVSSQHAQQGLLKEENHLEILDEFAGATSLRDEVKSCYQKLLPLKKKVIELQANLSRKKEEQELIDFQLNDILDADIQPNEDEDLEKKRQTLLNASKIFESVNRSIHELYDKEDSLMERMSIINNDLEKAGAVDDDLQTISQQLSGTLYELQDMVQELRRISSTIDLDPESLEITEQRRDLIAKLKRKYGGTLEAVFEKAELLEGQLTETKDIEARIESYQADINTLLKELADKAIRLSELRQKKAQELISRASKELHSLEMGKAKFDVSFSTKTSKDEEDIITPMGEKIGPDGIDKLVFLLSSNPGEDPKALAKIASGGELSRIVLALKAVLSGTKSLETLIFDEVDAGIGGAVSEKVGLKLKQLSQTHQIVCITHLAQIAKYAENQFRISKAVKDGRTYTTIVPLSSESERIEEIARMIGGANITDATRLHAGEMLLEVRR